MTTETMEMIFGRLSLAAVHVATLVATLFESEPDVKSVIVTAKELGRQRRQRPSLPTLPRGARILVSSILFITINEWPVSKTPPAASDITSSNQTLRGAKWSRRATAGATVAIGGLRESSLKLSTNMDAKSASNETEKVRASTTRPPPYPWQWIHPTKTGTSFANALYLLGCPEERPEDWTQGELPSKSVVAHKGIESPVPACRQRWTHGAVYGPRPRTREHWWIGEHAHRDPGLGHGRIFVSLREPVSRIVSLVDFNRKTGTSRQSGEGPRTDAEMADAILDSPNFSEMSSHMTSLLFPKGTRDLHLLLGEACDIIRNVTWVGFVDDYDRSVCLLHARYDFAVHPAEMTNMRPSASRDHTINMTRVGEIVRDRAPVLDDALYECARARFLEELERWAPSCL